MEKFLKIPYILRLLFFWLFYFAFFRILFITYHHARIPDLKHSETVMSFIYALRLDISIASALMFIPFVLWAIQQYNKTKRTHLINLWYHYVLISLVSFLSIINIKLYGELEHLMTYNDMMHLFFPDGPLNYVSLWSNLLLLIGSAGFAYIGIRIYRKYITNFSHPIENKNIRMANLIISSVLFIILYRGGFQAKVVSDKDSFYSDIAINNHIAINNIWYFGDSIVSPEE